MKLTVKIIAIAFLIFHTAHSKECDSGEIKVYVKSTTFLGCEIYNWRNETCRAFKGIPYAKPPIGNLRFKDPLPAEYDAKILDSRNDAKDCPSIFTDNASEDCLYLNVYSKSVKNISTPLPVIVFIHPGGFYLGSGASTFLGPQYLLDRDIVLVTFNYRLGSLGFLNLGTEEVPGNAGLKDQVMALKWTKDNIRYFGGDPNNVSLMGYSAGAMSVSLHLVSPMSQGLFHKAIIMSGSIPPQATIPRFNQLGLANKQAQIMGCAETSSPNQIVKCLNKFSGIEISSTLRRMFSFGKDNPIYLWLPVIEEYLGQERFLVEDPYVSLEAGRFAKVPLLTGFTNGEFCTSSKDIIFNNDLLSKFNNYFESLSPVCFMYSNHSRQDEITKAIRLQYFFNRKVDASQFEQLCDLFSDSLIRFGSYKIGSLASKYVNVYPYQFLYRGRISNLKFPGYNYAEHMDDLMYLFKMPMATFSPSDPEADVVELMISFFLEFAINGKPKEDFEFKTNQFASLHSSINITEGTYFKTYSFWNDLM